MSRQSRKAAKARKAAGSPWTNHDHVGESRFINPVDVAVQLAETPMTIDDRRVPDQDGQHAPNLLREEVLADQLAEAAANQVLAEATRGIAPDRATADREAQRWNTQRPEWEAHNAAHRETSQTLSALLTTVDCTISPRRKFISMIGKPLNVAGDTAVFASILYLTGTPIGLAVLSGASAAATLVGTGIQWGEEEKFALDRAERGPAPANAPVAAHRLFADAEGGNARRNLWRTIALSVSTAVFVAFTALGVSVGDPAGKAFAVGLLAAMTVAGSAALEAYGANEAADLYHQLVKGRDGEESSLKTYNEPAVLRAEAEQHAMTLYIAGERDALAAANTTRSIALTRVLANPFKAGDLAREDQSPMAPMAVSALPTLIALTSEPTESSVAFAEVESDEFALTVPVSWNTAVPSNGDLDSVSFS